jgi:endoglucanase
MLEHLHKRPPANTVALLLTRGEEVGFIGALASVLRPKLLRESDRVISIETSAEQPYAQQGGGVILRVGDRTSIFNSQFMFFLNSVAEDLQKRDKAFKFQRSLMPGGSCEATVFDAFGYITGAVCVPLGNYHNMDKSRRRIAAEYIDLDDWKCMVRLFVELAHRAGEFKPGHVALKRRLRTLYAKQSRKLSSPLHAGS